MAEWTGNRHLPADGEGEESDAPIERVVENGRLVLPFDLAPSVEAFLVASSQWRWATGAVVGPAGVAMFQPLRMGLDYAGARAAWLLARLRITPQIFANVRLMESAALLALGETRHE